MADDIQNLILQVKGREDVENLRKAIELEEEALRKLIAAHGSHDPVVQASGRVMLDLTNKLKDAEKAAGGVKSGLAGSGQSMLQFGRIVQDFQAAGMAGIVNNFEGMASALGIGAGIAGAAQLAGVAIYALTPKIKELWAAMTAGDLHRFSSALDDVKKRLEEMEKKDYKFKFDYEAIDEAKRRIDKIQEALAAFNALARQRGNIQEQVSKAVKDVIVEQAGGTDEEGGAENLRKLVAAAVGKELSAADTRSGQLARLRELLKTQEEMAKTGPTLESRETALTRIPKLQEEIDRIEKGIQTATDEYIKKLVADAAAGIDRARLELLKIYDENAEVFEKGAPGAKPVAGGFRFGLEQANAEVVRQKVRQDQDIENQKRMAKLGDDLKKKEAADFDRAAVATYRQQMAAKAGLNKPDITRQVEREDLSIKASGVGMMAERLLAGAQVARSQGERGFKGRTDDQLFDMVQREVQKYLHRQIGMDQFGRPVRANRGMGGEETSDLATRITAGARTQLEKDMTGLSGQNLNGTGRLIAITNQLTAAIRKQQMQAMQQSRDIDQLQNQAGQLGQTRLNRRGR